MGAVRAQEAVISAPASPSEGVRRIVDARGHRCPTPTLRLQRALRALRPGERLVLLVDDPLARIDVPHFAASQGHLVVSLTEAGDGLRITVQKGPGAA